MSAFSPIFRINATVEKGQHYYSPASTTSVLSGINEEKYAKVVELTAGQHDNINDGNACKLKSDIEMAYYFYRKKKNRSMSQRHVHYCRCRLHQLIAPACQCLQ
jgi:hypothetical protein